MRREWTEKEENYMIKYYLRQPVKKTAESLGRSEYSVKRKASKMGLNHYTEYLSAKVIAKSFNSDVDVVIRWIEKFNLPARKVICDNQKRYLIDPDVFWEWAFKNKSKINWSKYIKGSILPEPDWVEIEKKIYKFPNNRKKFTTQEKNRIKILLQRGKSYQEIADEIGRTYYSVSHICRNIYM